MNKFKQDDIEAQDDDYEKKLVEYRGKLKTTAHIHDQLVAVASSLVHNSITHNNGEQHDPMELIVDTLSAKGVAPTELLLAADGLREASRKFLSVVNATCDTSGCDPDVKAAFEQYRGL